MKINICSFVIENKKERRNNYNNNNLYTDIHVDTQAYIINYYNYDKIS